MQKLLLSFLYGLFFYKGLKITSLPINDFEQAKHFFLQGLESYERKSYQEAEIYFRKSLSIVPERMSTLINLSSVLIKLDKFQQAYEITNEALILYPDNEFLYLNLSVILKEFNRLEGALNCIDKALKLRPEYLEAKKHRDLVLKEMELSDHLVLNAVEEIKLGNFDRAFMLISDAIKIDSTNAQAHNNKGLILKQLHRYDEALASFNIAIQLKNNLAEAYFNSGLVFHEIKQLEKAIESFGKAIEFSKNFSEAYFNRGKVFSELKFINEALKNYDRAIEIKPAYPEAFINRGVLLAQLSLYSEALKSYDKAIELKHDLPEAHSNRGIVLHKMRRFEDAITSYNTAIELSPKYSEAYYNKGISLEIMKDFDNALSNYAKALQINPSYEYLFGVVLYTKMFQCNWSKFDANLGTLVEKINSGKKVAPSFGILALTDSPKVQRKASEIWVNDKYPENMSLGPIKIKGANKPKIRLGYYSADFHEHATTYLMAELFERHDKSKFEIIAFSFGPDKKDAMRQRVSAAFDQFLDVRLKSDKEIAQLSRELSIDIAIDLKGLTQDQRIGIFAYRAAPIQVSYLGYPGTMGAPYIDYLIADRTLIPEESQRHYSEKIVYLPHSYQVNDRQRVIAQRVFTREELGLPKEGFVFCCFNNNYKITPATFEGWVRVLKAVEGSVLWLLEDNEAAGRNLRKEAQARGLDPSRLVFAKRMKLPEHLARHRAADLFLDTLPYNAHTTASDALWAGLPVLTCMGVSFASRVAASLLNAIELPELITDTQQEYEALAIELAKDSDTLKGIRDKLERNRLTTPLFNTDLFTQHIEDAYLQLMEH